MQKLLSLSMVAVLFAMASIASADDATTQKTKLETDAETQTPPSSIDFGRELGVSLQALSHLGRSIEDAQEEADPICIASAANILAVAESLSDGKKASLTSEQLWDEAILLAEMRKSSTELAALAKMTSGEKAADLMERSESAKTGEQAAAKADEAGETSRELDGDLHVINRSHDWVRIYVDGRYLGRIGPHQSGEVHLHDAHHLVGRGQYGHYWHEDIHGHRHHYDWVLRDPHDPHHH
ncbi:hypothetical protein Pla22_42140 [Rubripirellula amarantea]|uniref:Secreted protein n=1 Tax=Rubripirellula amarantea TaxID=2527999 RepID=A0A5C5WKW7_9BACT|nr:hypothetical protein [Rubripirellula amarantea]TWT51436.1 hypothetical protein Pla22_42140 [Rubripirellula amarantea]